MSTQLEFNRVTFGLPVETFRVDAYIALEERLPVVTEFVLRLLKVCGKVPLPALRDYFGFSDGEALAVVESLSRQGLIEILDDEAQLTLFALERFQEAGEDYPRFSKVELKSDEVTFDLVSFTPLRAIGREMPSDNILKLNASEDALGSSVDRARSAYRHKYAEVAALRADLRERSFGVYSVEDVESKRRNYVPVPVAFLLDSDGQVERKIDEAFERIAPPELVAFVNEQVTGAIPRTLTIGTPGLEEFIDTFELKVVSQYMTGKKFDVLRYLTDVQIARSVKYGEGMEPLFGSLYLPENREKIVSRLKDRRGGKRRHGPLLTSLAWLVPDSPLWGRGEYLSSSVNAFAGELQAHGLADSLYMFAYSEQGQDTETVNQLRTPQLRELHFSRPLAPDYQLMSGRLELMLYPTGFMAAICHVPLPGSSGLWIGIGFLSTRANHLDTAQKLMRKAMGGNRYGRRGKLSQKDTRAQPNSFEEACGFLNYCGLVEKGNTDS